MSAAWNALVNGAILSALLTAAVWLALWIAPRRKLNAATRYAVWWATLVVTIALPLIYWRVAAGRRRACGRAATPNPRRAAPGLQPDYDTRSEPRPSGSGPPRAHHLTLPRAGLPHRDRCGSLAALDSRFLDAGRCVSPGPPRSQLRTARSPESACMGCARATSHTRRTMAGALRYGAPCQPGRLRENRDSSRRRSPPPLDSDPRPHVRRPCG